MRVELPLEALRTALRADAALLLVPDGPAAFLSVTDRAGALAAHLPARVHAPAGSLLARAIAGSLPGRLPRLPLMAANGASADPAGRSRRLGPTIVVAAMHPALRDAVVLVTRQPGACAFDDDDLAHVRALVSGGVLPSGTGVPGARVGGVVPALVGERPAAGAPPTLASVVEGSAIGVAFDAAPAGMSLVDGDLRYRWANVALCAMLGRVREEVLALAVPDVVHPDHVDRAVALYDRLRSGTATAVRDRLRFARPDGARVWADVGGSVFAGTTEPRLYLAQQFDVTVEQDLADDLAHRVMHDDLTGLANRALLRERLRAVLARRGDGRAVAFYLDVDRFTSVNAKYGHGAGDDVLREIAARLLGVVREGDTVARVGGDEFVVAGEVADVPEASRIAQRIGLALRPRMSVGGVATVVHVSVGVALSRREDRPEDLIARADRALLDAKGGRPHLVAVDGERDDRP